MNYKVYRVMRDKVEFQLGPDCLTVADAIDLVNQAERKFINAGIESFKIYSLYASLPFAAPADASKPQVNSAISQL